MDPDLHLLLQSQLCALVALLHNLQKVKLLGSQSPKDALMEERLRRQIERLRERGVSLDEGR